MEVAWISTIKIPRMNKILYTLSGESQWFKEDVLFIGKRLNNSIKELISHVIFVHLLCPEKVFVVDNQQTCYLLKNFMGQIVPSIFVQISLFDKFIMLP